MAVHIKIRLLLLLVRLQKKLNFSTISPEDFRAYNRNGSISFNKFLHYPPEQLFWIRDELIPVSKNEQIKIRIYKPSNNDDHAILMFFHGGGFVAGDIESHDLNCRRLAKQNNCVVVSVDYRLAPEYPFPVPGEDCYAATVWAFENAASLGADQNNIAVMGDSAGGTLATVVAMMARDMGGPKIACQILIYPSTDATLSMHSINQLAKHYFLTKEMMEWFVKHYCGNEKDLKQPYLSPLFAGNLENMPPALIITCEYDPLKDDGEAYAKRLREAGNKVSFTEYKGMTHVFFQMPKYLKATRTLEAQVSATLNEFLRPVHPSKNVFVVG